MPKEILRITSAGSVDDGKSTILARLLLDTGSIYEDQLSKNFDSEKIADLLDGLESEREQGITIDVAHRFFDSKTRRYQIADSPGHEQYTRNMATACAGSDALVLVVDARVGLKSQTLHHLEIALRLGIRQIVFAVNKMDLVNFREKAFTRIEAEIEMQLLRWAELFQGIEHVVLPVSGLKGNNVVSVSSKLKWFEGPTLLQALDSLRGSKPNQNSERERPALFQVQYTQRLPGGGRRLLGHLIQGRIRSGDALNTNNTTTNVKRIWVSGEKKNEANAGDQISLEVDKEIDIKRGEVLAQETFGAHHQFQADLIWLSSEPGSKNRRYIFKSGSQSCGATVTRVYLLDPAKEQKRGETLRIETNQIVRANIALTEAFSIRPFRENHLLGSFVLIEPTNGQTVAVGTIHFALRRSENVVKHYYQVTKDMHAELTRNKPKVIWFTGLSGSGKSTLANEFSQELFNLGKPHAVLDGDNLRFGINKDLGFTEEDRTENIRRTAEVARLMCDSGLIVIVALVSPMTKDREMAKAIVGEERFNLIYVDTTLEVCKLRDSKGLYAKATAGKLPNLPGVNSVYQPPENSIRVSTLENLKGSKGVIKELLDYLVFEVP